MAQMTKQEAQLAAQLALGRLFRIGSRPYQEGDHETYDHIVAVVKEAAEVLKER